MHLVRRFIGFLRARSLSPAEQSMVRSELSKPLARLFFAQRPEDQRHAFAVMALVKGHPELREPALLHDIGKTDSDLGAIGRALATVWNGAGLRGAKRWRSYVDHGPIGADLVQGLGVHPITTAFMLHHPGPPPDGIDSDSWSILSDADNT